MEELPMKSVLVALSAGAFAIVAVAQTLAPAPATPSKPTATERQADVKSSTEAAANVKASKETTKMTTAEKNKFISDAQKDAQKKGFIGDKPPDSYWKMGDALARSKKKAATNPTPDVPARDPQ